MKMVKSNKSSSLTLILFIKLLCLPSIKSFKENLKRFNEENLSIYPVIMPLVTPTRNEVYLCTTVDVSNFKENSFWIRGFEPKVNNRVVHHMALAGCFENPISDNFAPLNVWNCGGFKSNAAIDYAFPLGSVCNVRSKIKTDKNIDTTLFLWSRNGSKLMLPKHVGFKFGGKSRIQHFVLQVYFTKYKFHDTLAFKEISISN